MSEKQLEMGDLIAFPPKNSQKLQEIFDNCEIGYIDFKNDVIVFIDEIDGDEEYIYVYMDEVPQELLDTIKDRIKTDENEVE